MFPEPAYRSMTESLPAIDVVELSWEIQRRRVSRHILLELYSASEKFLRPVDLAGLPPETEDAARRHIRRDMLGTGDQLRRQGAKSKRALRAYGNALLNSAQSACSLSCDKSAPP